MRNTRKWAVVACLTAASAVAAFGLSGSAQAAADEDGKPRTAVKATADPAFAAKEKAASRGVVNTAASRAALKTVSDRVVNYVARNGAKYSFSVYTDPASGAVVVESNAPSRVVDSLTAARGATSLSGVAVRSRSASITDAFHRRDDIPSFWGGAGISAGGGTCSTGYAVRNAVGTRYMSTAGHCFANGTLVKTESLANNVGTVFGRQLPTFNGQAKDMELMSGSSYAGRTYNGGIFSMTSNPVVAAGGAFVGYANYCHSGRTTGEHCGHTATSTNATVCTSSGCKTNTIRFTGGVMIQPGDSGGAFYAKDAASGVWIRGHVIATDGVTGWAESWTKVAATYGVNIVTG